MKDNLLISILTILLITMGCAKKEINYGQDQTQLVKEDLCIGVINWPASQYILSGGIAEDIENCLLYGIERYCPNAILLDQDFIRDALFPLLESTTQPTSEIEMVEMLSREDVIERLNENGVKLLVTFSGQTLKEGHGFITPSYGGFIGFAWIDKKTNISVDVWKIDKSSRLKHFTTYDEGTTWIPAFFIPVPFPAMTLSNACRAMSEQIVKYVEESTYGCD